MLSTRTETAQKFYDKALTNSSNNRWYSIHLGNLAKTMTVFAMKPLLEDLHKALIAKATERHTKLSQMPNLPAVIKVNEDKTLANVTAGKHPALSVLRREIKKWEMK